MNHKGQFMTPVINRERLTATFIDLCEISSPSRKEGQIAARLIQIFKELGADLIYVDGSATNTGSETGNLIIRFDGNMPDRDGFFLSCHMDTVGPCADVKVVRTGKILTSAGDTILGADDKSGIAAIIELITLLRENNTPHPMIEIIITTCEEIGLLGAKHLEFDKITSPFGYALDSSGIDHVVVGAPAANRLKVEIKGLAAHAGLCPEDGINALTLAVQALSQIKTGRLDDESTCNFGLIEGGVATNIVPALVTLRGEIRSHSPEKLDRYTEEITQLFVDTVQQWPSSSENGERLPAVSFEIFDDYPALSVAPDSPVIRKVKKAAAIAGRELNYINAGGGSDANIFHGHGFPTAIIATGMNKVHTVNEEINLDDMVGLTELLHALTQV